VLLHQPRITAVGLHLGNLAVKTGNDLEDALKAALKNTESFTLLNVHLDKMDHSQALERLGKYLASHVKAKKPD